MRFRIAVAGLILAAWSGSAGAQGANVNCKNVTADACQQVVDLYGYMMPQLGIGLIGGNTTLAQGGSMGGRTFGILPKIAVDVRFNVVLGGFPNLQTPTVTLPAATAPPAARAFTTKNTMIPLPSFDVAVGLFKGIPLGVTNVGGVDALLSAAYIPSLTLNGITITPDSPLKLGYGLRVGILQEGLVSPGVGFSIIQRGLPKTTITGKAGTTTVAIKDLDFKATSWRFTVSKSFLIFGLAAGVGRDMSTASTGIAITPPTPVPAVSFTGLNQDLTRTNYFVDLSMKLLVLRIVVTGGMVSGGTITTYNSFDTPADKSRIYGSVGVRVGR